MQIDYKCSRCGTQTPRDELSIKRVAFKKMGSGGRWLRSRNIAWLCKACLIADPHWNLPDQTTIDKAS